MPKNNIATSDPLSKYAIASDGNLQPVANCDQLQITDIEDRIFRFRGVEAIIDKDLCSNWLKKRTCSSKMEYQVGEVLSLGGNVE